MKNVLIGIVICLCAIFLMSHNVSAITSGSFIPNTPIGPFWVSRGASDPTGQYVCNNSSSLLYSHVIYTGLNMNRLMAGKDYLFAIPFFNPNENNALDTKMPIQWRTSSDGNITIKEVEVVQGSAAQSTLYMIVHSENYVSSDLLYFYSDDFIIIAPGECLGNTGWFVPITWTGISNYTDQLNALNNAIQNLNNNMPSQQSINNINNSVQDLNSAVENHYQAEQDALDNISDQDASDLSGDTDNQQSTNLIGVFSSFVSALGNITASNNCNITLAFPSFAGGSQTVNVCQNKDKGGNLVAIFSSLTLIAFYIPLALKLLSMILNEIRSFTNG